MLRYLLSVKTAISWKLFLHISIRIPCVSELLLIVSVILVLHGAYIMFQIQLRMLVDVSHAIWYKLLYWLVIFWRKLTYCGIKPILYFISLILSSTWLIISNSMICCVCSSIWIILIFRHKWLIQASLIKVLFCLCFVLCCIWVVVLDSTWLVICV